MAVRVSWLLPLFCGLAGCAAPGGWAPNSGVQMGSFPAALTYCQAEADKLPVTQQGASQPFFIAAAQQQFMVDCMATKGWRPA